MRASEELTSPTKMSDNVGRDDTYRSENRNSLFAEPHGVEDIVVENRLKQVVFIIGFERRLSGHHLIHQHPKGPPVHRGSILQLLQDLNSTQ